MAANGAPPKPEFITRAYQQELLEESLNRNLVIALDTGSGKTHIAILRMKLEAERNPNKISWFLAPTVTLIEQQKEVIARAIPVSVGAVTGASEPDQWKDYTLWRRLLDTHRIMVTTPQILLDALHHAYVNLDEIGLLVFDEAHHATSKHPYNSIMKNFYFTHFPPSDRPMILGLTASPIYGGHVDKAFNELERNLDSLIRSSRFNRDELASHVHRPIFKHIIYPLPPYKEEDTPLSGPSLNVIALHSMIRSLSLDEDPYVISLRRQLSRLPQGSFQYNQIDQKLSKTIDKRDTFTHKGLYDFLRAACDICYHIGSWAADWYVDAVIKQAQEMATTFNMIMSTWRDDEKQYLLKTLAKVQLWPISFDPEKIRFNITDRVRVLADCLLEEEAIAQSLDDVYSGIIFVQRRDAVIALAQVLSLLPETAGLFRVGCLLGSAGNSKRHSFLDISGTLLKETSSKTLDDFRSGEKNLIVSTAVAEEGIDIQACGSVIRFDPPPNMVAWAQSRGRARKKRSSFTLMFDESAGSADKIRKWENMENEMMRLYNDAARRQTSKGSDDEEDPEEECTYRVPSTGALLTTNSVMSHLSHFCAILSSGRGSHNQHAPLFSLDPPEYSEGWHLGSHGRTPHEGPWRATVTLPRLLPSHLRNFTGPERPSKLSAKKHAAFLAYIQLYEDESPLLDDNLLPLVSVVKPDTDGQVEVLLKEVEQRASMAQVSVQLDPWMTRTTEAEVWHKNEIVFGSLPPLYVLTRKSLPKFREDEFPVFYIPGSPPIRATIRASSSVESDPKVLAAAREYTLRMLTPIHGPRMDRDRKDFAYLFLPHGDGPDEASWRERRGWMAGRYARGEHSGLENKLQANAAVFAKEFEYPADIALVRDSEKPSKALQLIGWHYGPLREDEIRDLSEKYEGLIDTISFPLLYVQPFPRRVNFLVPLQSETEGLSKNDPYLLVPQFAMIDLISQEDLQYSMLLPSLIRWMSKAITVNSLRDTLFANKLVQDTPLSLLTVALTAPVSQEENYQRLETLGDTVLKYITSIQLFGDYPTWHEGYLARRKDHAINNNQLAVQAVGKEMHQWIIRDRFVIRKWRPRYVGETLVANVEYRPKPNHKAAVAETTASVTQPEVETTKGGAPSPDAPPQEPTKAEEDEDEEESRKQDEKKPNKKRKKIRSTELSTKVLADVVEALIGAAYEHGGTDAAVRCVEIFGLGLPRWDTVSSRVETALTRVENIDSANLPRELEQVEEMLGYKFKRRMLLVEALTHASYQGNLDNVSYERLEFIGDAALDMVVTDYLYHAPGKRYSPGHMHLRKEALVNQHFLAYICLNTSIILDSSMPAWDRLRNAFAISEEQYQLYLYQFLMHSSHTVLNDQGLTFSRYEKSKDNIQRALERSALYPWALLTGLQSPKFLSDMVESLLGAVFLDSGGKLDAIRDVLKKLGYYSLMERIVKDEVDVLHPVSRLAIWAARQDVGRKLRIMMEKSKEDGTIACIIYLDDEEVTRATEKFRGTQSKLNVRFTAADAAIRKLGVIEDEDPDDIDEVDWPGDAGLDEW